VQGIAAPADLKLDFVASGVAVSGADWTLEVPVAGQRHGSVVPDAWI
jgi:hypothetical protein